VGIYLGLGSNVGDREANMCRALQSLGAAKVEVIRTASLYSTEPRDFEEQPWFLNTVFEVQTDADPEDLLRRCLAVEELSGRVRSIPKGPRTLDIDILLYHDHILDIAGLKIPHPHFRERRFVLVPLSELAPELRDPVSGLTIQKLLEACKDEGQVQRYAAALL
jgi:2-amino-4-hydroxy-6-hydroxymethyldihydropteridine diphosphokinase